MKEYPGDEPPEGNPADGWSYESQEWEGQMGRLRANFDAPLNALEAFGTRAEMKAARGFATELDGAMEVGALITAREQIVQAVRADIAPD